MNLRQMTGTSKQPVARQEVDDGSGKRSLTLLIEGAALNMPEIDIAGYKEFRANVGQLALKIPDRLPEDDKLALVQNILREFERYRDNAENTLRDRRSAWRVLAAKLLVELLARLGIDSTSAEGGMLVQRIASLLTGEEIRAFSVQLSEFLRVSRIDGETSKASRLKVADRSIANDNAAGLRGGGAAVEHVRRVMEQGGRGFVVFFQLGLLNMIGERFGIEAVEDSLMAVSAFLTSSLRNDDAVYHWSDSSLLAVLQSPANEQILTAAMRRIVDNNRDITIQIGGRSVMLRVPLEFDMIQIGTLRAAEDLNKYSQVREAKW